MSSINLENLYRGVINESQTFYLAARLNASDSNETLIKSGLNIDSSNPHFLLCLDRYNNAGVQYHRLYWSNDPTDYVAQLESNSQNQGAARFTYKTENRNEYTLSYQTKLNYQPFDNTNNSFGLDNIKKTTAINNERNNSFNIIPREDKSYNLDNSIFASVPYNISSDSGITQNWNFRQNVTSANGGTSLRAPLADFTSNNNMFEKVNSISVKLSGTLTSTITNNQLNLSGLSVATNYLGFDDIPTNNGIAYMTQGTSTEYFTYTKYDKETKYINVGTRGLFGTTSFSPGTSTSFNLFVSVDNDDDNFKTMRELLTTNYSENETYLDIFFIPTVRHNILTGGNYLEFITNYNLTSGAIDYYNYKNGLEYVNGVTLRDISFLTNYLNDTLPANFSYSKMDSSYPLIPVYSNTTTASSSSTVIWTTVYESLKSYYYNYCRGNDLCGNCMGLTNTRAYNCHVNNNTLENYKKNINLSVSNNNNAPLSDTPKNSQTSNIFTNYTIPIVLLCISVFLIIVFVAIYLNLVKERNIELGKILKS